MLCLITFQGPKEDVLYINICGWKRVPAAASYSDPVPVCGGRMEKLTEDKGTKTPSHHCYFKGFFLTKRLAFRWHLFRYALVRSLVFQVTRLLTYFVLD